MLRFLGGFQLGLAVYGLLALIAGYARLPPLKPVIGGRARAIGVLLISPWPVGYLLGYCLAHLSHLLDWEPTLEEVVMFGNIIGCTLLAVAIGAAYLVAATGQPRADGQQDVTKPSALA